jgi:hypothetical protein
VTPKTWPSNIQNFEYQWDLFNIEPLVVDSISKIGVEGQIVGSDEPEAKVIDTLTIEESSRESMPPTQGDIVTLSMEGEVCKHLAQNSPIALRGTTDTLRFRFHVVTITRQRIRGGWPGP